jgi:hypothetical protein
MKRLLFLLASFSYCLTSYAAEVSAAKLEKPVKAGQISQARKSGAILTTSFHNVKSPAYCIGVAGGNTKDRAYIKQGVCSNAARDQVWLWEPVSGPGSDYVVLKNAKNRRLCLGVEHGSHDRANIMLGICNGNPDQRWIMNPVPFTGPNGAVAFHIKNPYRLCIGVEGGATARAQLKQNKCNVHAPDQAWYSYSFPDDDNRA